MNQSHWIVLTLAYIVGLLATGIFYFDSLEPSWFDLIIVATSLGIPAVIGSLVISKYLKIKQKVWLIAYAIAFLAVLYFQLRIPLPQADDISYQITSEQSQLVLVTGKILNEPRLSGKQKLKFWLQAKQVSLFKEQEAIKQNSVSGKLYVTVPLLPEHKIHPGEILSIKGILYAPKSPNNPGSFDFKNYLYRQGIFAGLKGLKVEVNNIQPEPLFAWWKIRRRIIRSQVKGLGSPLGQLLSSIVLGRRAVDLPEDIRNLFITAGLAHVLAASGFHVSLLLGVILKLTNSLSAKSKLIIGTITLLSYLSLTGFSPSVLRAGLMGLAVLIATAMGGKVKSKGALLLSAVIILLINPLWIWSLSFQLSFLATLGLLVTAPVIEKRLDFIPTSFAIAIAFPLAAIIWTVPLITYYFNSIATYSILVNIITTPLVTIISLGGMISGFASLIFTLFGSILSWTLFYPILTLITILQFFTNLPGSSLAIGKISLGLLITIYLVIIFVWINQKSQKYWYSILLFIIILIASPIIYSHFNLTQVTIIATKPSPIIIIQDQGKVVIVQENTINTNNIKYNLLPFLSKQGINKIDYNIIAANKLDFSKFATNLKPSLLTNTRQNWHQLTPQTIITTNSTKISAIKLYPQVLDIKVNKQNWLLVTDSTKDNLSFIKQYVRQHDISALLWWDKNPDISWLNSLNIKTAIISDADFQTNNSLAAFYILSQDGAITWQPDSGFDNQLLRNRNKNSFW